MEGTSMEDKMARFLEIMSRTNEEVRILKEGNIKVHANMSRLDGENTKLRQEMERLRQALVEERIARRAAETSLWDAMEEQRLEGRRLAATETTNIERSRDVSTQTDSGMTTSKRQVNISYLQQAQLKDMLQYLDWPQLFRVRRVCKRWRGAVDSIINDCRRENRERLEAMSAPTSDIHLALLVGQHPNMAGLQAPAADSDTPLSIVASRCQQLKKVDLRGFTFDGDSLRRLATNNCASLHTVILPAGVDAACLAALLVLLQELKRLSVAAADLPGLKGALPWGLRELNVRGPEVTDPMWLKWPAFGFQVTVQGVTDGAVGLLPDLGRPIAELLILDCPGVVNLEPVSRLPQLECLILSDCPGVVNLEPVSRLPQLQRLFLSDCPGVVNLKPVSRLPQLQYLTLSDCPGVVNLEPVSRLPQLKELTLAGGVTDTALDSLSGCPQLYRLELDLNRPAETAITAAAVSRLVVSCRRLRRLCLHSTLSTSRAVLAALQATNLGLDSDTNRPRTIELWVPGNIYQELKSLSGGRVRVVQWVPVMRGPAAW